MGYLYYPGCSLEGTAREYDLSCRELFRAMGVCLTDIPDWTCCGATAAQYVDQFLSVVLPARNLALAEKTETGLDVLVPCSACYLNLKKAREEISGNHALQNQINQVLAKEGLAVHASLRIRHLLDVLSRDGAVAHVAHLAETVCKDGDRPLLWLPVPAALCGIR